MCSLDRDQAATRDADRTECAHGSDRSASDPDGSAFDLGRRRVLGAGAAGAAASLAGCLGGVLPGGEEDAPDPIAVSGGLDCDVCRMVIEKHPGPNGQIFYADNSPEDHDDPARFDSLKQCFFPYKLEHEQMGWSIDAAYVTDYSAVDYDVTTQGGVTTISSHAAPESFARAADLKYVVNTDVEGAMGPDFIPFSDQGDAESFADEHGGQAVDYDEIDEAIIGQ